MANIAGSYDPNAQANEQLASGEYRAEIVESDIVPVSQKNDVGDCLKLTWRVADGPQTGRLIWQKLNLYFRGNNSGQVVQIANSQFAEVRKATGKQMPQDSSELHHIPCMITVGPQKNSPEYQEVKRVKPVGGQPAQAQAQAPVQTTQQNGQTPPQTGAPSAAPWNRPAA